MRDEQDIRNASPVIPSPLSSRVWYALDVTLETAADEAVEYALMESGALGTESSSLSRDLIQVIAYFDVTPDRTRVREALADALRIYELHSSSLHEMQLREVEDRDWLGEWKKNWQPAVIGRFIIAPPWSDVKLEADQIVIRIEPGMAFGTGTHETTRLCLSAIEKYFDGQSFLDVGTGTGILAIAAARLSATAHIEAFDTDANAIAIACENARLNNVPDRIDFQIGTTDETTTSAELVCANLTADVIVSLVPQLIAATSGRLVLSGILQEQVEMVEECLGANGITEFEIEAAGEWVAIIV